MKKYFKLAALAVAALFGLLFVSCEKSDVEGSVVGTWEVTHFEFSTLFDEEDGEGLQVGDTMTFYEDGTYEDSEDIARWTKKGNILTIIYDDDDYLPAVMKIVKLTDKVMEVELDYVFVQAKVKMRRVQ